MKIGITITTQAYTPEAFAYKDYLEKMEHCVQLDTQDHLYPDNDLNIYFMGTRPFWKKKQGTAIEIHEYQSLSTPPYANVKNLIKKTINRKPQGRIFLNQAVQNHLRFNDNIPHIYRDMGIHNNFFASPHQENTHEYDIVYSGSIDNRPGLCETIRLLGIKYKILVIGTLSNLNRIELQKNKNITCVGRIKYQDIPELYKKAKFGLNYTPDIFPFNIQTSTKTLEYLAAGLNLISNKYHWIEEFCIQKNYQPIWLHELMQKDYSLHEPIKKELPNMNSYRWDTILQQSCFNKFITNLLNDSIHN